jgi:tRNA(fMet)-specific endonuclease VapC
MHEVIVLDTDHMVVLKYSDGPEFRRLSARMAASADQDFATTCVSLEEQLRGWLALINRTRDLDRQVSAYAELNKLVDYFACWTRLDFDALAAQQFRQLRSQKIRIGTMDLKIAAIAGVHGATLLSANLRDFQQVPGLRAEDWLH